MSFKRLMKNNKGISPIFATLILIAIAVIAGVVVYMFTSGTLATMTNGGTAAQEKMTVQGASISAATSGNTIVYIQQTGGPAATINSLIIKDAQGNTIGVVAVTAAGISPSPSPAPALTTGTLYTITEATPTGVKAGTSYTVTVTTAAGGSFISTQVVASA